jgi:Tol biopolymer transport system component
MKPRCNSSRIQLAVLAFALSHGGLHAQTTERVSVDSRGWQGTEVSRLPSISADGRYVAFYSWAPNLVPGDTNYWPDVFVRDRQIGATKRVSVNSLGVEGNLLSADPSISADGRFVVFGSSSNNLVPGDTNWAGDIFVHDCETGRTRRVSVSSTGTQADLGNGGRPTISGHGRFVAFSLDAGNLVPGDMNASRDVFVHDLLTGVTERVSVDSFGVEANGESDHPSISADGRLIAFESDASNLVPGDTNGTYDIFVHDRQTGVTERVSVDSSGAQGNSGSFSPSLSADGRNVAFGSSATNLVPWDTNGARDVFVHNRLTGVSKRVSVDSFGTPGNDRSNDPSISATGRYVAFSSKANNLVLGDERWWSDIFVHDRQTGVTERVSVDSFGAQGRDSSGSPSISFDGRHIAFDSSAKNLVSGDSNSETDVFVHDRWNGLGANSIYLMGPTSSSVLAPVHLSWRTTRGGSDYWLGYSKNTNGGALAGHVLDIGSPMTLLATGTNSVNGIGEFQTSPVPRRAVGHTIYFEVVARDADGILYDSNVLAVTFH